MIIWLAVIIVAVFLDQLTKYYTVLHLKPIDTYPIIEDVLHLTYVENTGAAFGMMKNARWVFMITSTLAIIAILGYMIWRSYIQKDKLHWMEGLSLAFIVGGGIGNMIDRTVLGYVVDMIDVRLIHFAVFNVADSFVCVGAGLMILYLIVFCLKDVKESPDEEKGSDADEGAETVADDPVSEEIASDGDGVSVPEETTSSEDETHG